MPRARSSFVRAARAGCVAFALLAAAMGNAHGRDVEDLYSAEVAVADRSAAELARGAAAALAIVLTKLTGDRAAPANAAVRPLLGRAGRLMLSYAYGPASAGQGLVLKADFDEQVLAAELTGAGVALWGKERPDTLVWLVVDDGVERQVIGGDEAGPLATALRGRAAARGVPLLLPIMDIEESRALLAAADWTTLAEAALALSARYGTPAVLVSYLRQVSPGLWEAQWKVRVAADDFAWSQEGDLPELVVEEGVDALADALARRYADPAMLAAADRLTLTVTGLGNADDYARVATYLASLDTVGDLFVSAVDANGIRYTLTARGGRAGLAQSIVFGQVLDAVPGRADTYRLRR